MRLAAAVLARGGEPATRVSPVRARRHVETLRAAGWSVAGIAEAAGIHYVTLWRITSGATKHVSWITEGAVLAIRP